MNVDERMRQEWRDLRFYYEFREANAQWRLVGSLAGLLRFCDLLREYASDARNTRLSEHEHYGPYRYLKVMTWHEAAILPDAIAGTLADLMRLADIVEGRLRKCMGGNTFCVEAKFAQANSAALCFSLARGNLSVKHRALFPILLTGAAWIFCLNGPVVAQRIKRTPPISVSTFAFQPIYLSRRYERVVVEVQAHKMREANGHKIFESLEIVTAPIRNRQHRVLSEPPQIVWMWFKASLYRHRKSGDYLLAIEANGGQHDHTRVYYIDPRTLKARPLFGSIGVIYGDASGLAAGRVVEHSPDQYVDRKPAGFRRRTANVSEYLKRTWTYRPKIHQFTAGRYRADR